MSEFKNLMNTPGVSEFNFPNGAQIFAYNGNWVNPNPRFLRGFPSKINPGIADSTSQMVSRFLANN